MKWVLLILFSALVAETLIRLPILRFAGQIVSISGRSVKTMQAAGVSDHWKEKAMGAYALRTLKSTAGLFASFLGLGLVAAIVVFGAEQVATGFTAFLLSWTGILASTAAATLFAVARSRWVKRHQ